MVRRSMGRCRSQVAVLVAAVDPRVPSSVHIHREEDRNLWAAGRILCLSAESLLSAGHKRLWAGDRSLVEVARILDLAVAVQDIRSIGSIQATLVSFDVSKHLVVPYPSSRLLVV